MWRNSRDRVRYTSKAGIHKVLLTQTELHPFLRPVISLSKNDPKKQTGNSFTEVAHVCNFYTYVYRHSQPTTGLRSGIPMKNGEKD